MRLGFLGTGVITSAIVTGLCTLPEAIGSIMVSPRNRQKAEHLSNIFGNVTIAASNQEVLDQSEVVVLAILPQDKKAILEELAFNKNHIVINLLAGITNDEITPLISPANRLIRAMPLPCVAKHVGPIAIYPADQVGDQVFGALGKVVAVNQESQLETLSIITALMAPYYGLLETIVTWSNNEGVDRKQSADYVANMLEALSVMSQEIKDGNLEILMKESMTPGGLNETAMRTFLANGGFNPWAMSLEAVKNKIKQN